MYEAHSEFIQPRNEQVKVWRYIDFTEFVSLLDWRQLYFTRADRLDDPFQESWPKADVAARQQIAGLFGPEGREAVIAGMAMLEENHRKWRRHVALNCWHMNEYESAAMWKLYLKSNEAISIQSTCLNLRESFIDDERIFLGVVRYIDYDSEWIGVGNFPRAFMHKRKSFGHEREIRALVLKDPGGDLSKETITHGLKVSVDIEKLVERVLAAPTAPDWFAELVRAVVNRYGYNFEVVQSKLDERPMH